MPLVNTDGLVLVGPGSEWFWTMLQFIVVVVSLLGLYRQLRLQGNANAFEHLDAFERELASERITRLKLAVLVALRDGADPAAPPLSPAISIATFWEKIGALTRAGHIEPRLLRSGSGPDCQAWWGILGPWIKAQRADEADPTIYEHFEWLSGAMDALDRKIGAPPTVTEAWLARTLESRIAANLARLRDEQALRAVVPPVPDAFSAQAAPPADPPV